MPIVSVVFEEVTEVSIDLGRTFQIVDPGVLFDVLAEMVVTDDKYIAAVPFSVGLWAVPFSGSAQSFF